jgi:hypothetical protein
MKNTALGKKMMYGKEAGNDAFDGCHQPQGRCHQTLAGGQKGRGTSTRGDMFVNG